MRGEHLTGVDFGFTTHVKIQSLAIWDFGRHQVWHEDPAIKGEQEDGEPAADTWDRMVPFIHALIYPALFSEPHSPQGCRVSTFCCLLEVASWTASEEDLWHSREALQGTHMAGITLQAAGNLAMTLCQAPCGWKPPLCSPRRAQRNCVLQCDLAQGAGNHPLILCELEREQEMLSRGT